MQTDNGQTLHKNGTLTQSPQQIAQEMDPLIIDSNQPGKPASYKSDFLEVRRLSLATSPGNETITSVTIGLKWPGLD